jgi:hypothetical protein
MNPQQELLVKKIGEQSLSYNILHRESQSYYGWLNHFIAIPVICLSTLSGSASFIFGGEKSASVGIGILSVCIGIIQTLGTYFRFSQLAELHRICSISYQKLYMKISAELTLPPSDREDPTIMMSNIRSELERLQEVAPPIPINIIEAYKKKYKNYTDISRPEITNGLEAIIPYTASIVEKPVDVVVETKVKEEKKKTVFKV